jgi:SAM-dependent methyltransferase
MDSVVLHHALEPLSDPRDALREIARVLHPGGRIVIVAFNPWSVLGLRRLWAKVGRDAFSPHRFVNPVRLLDWLGLLGLELEEPVRFRSTGLPFRIRRRNAADDAGDAGTANLLPEPARRRHGIEIPLGDVFLISAVKQAYYMRPKSSVVRVTDVKLAGVAYPKATFPRQTARIIPVDFDGERR